MAYNLFHNIKKHVCCYKPNEEINEKTMVQDEEKTNEFRPSLAYHLIIFRIHEKPKGRTSPENIGKLKRLYEMAS